MKYAVTSTVEHSGDVGSVNTLLEKVIVYGVDEEPLRVLLNNQTVLFTYTADKVSTIISFLLLYNYLYNFILCSIGPG